jgi:hypothetical protein
MEDKIFDIVTDLLRGDISKDQAIDDLTMLCNSTTRNKSDELKIEWLLNDTYQVVDKDKTVLYQGRINDCNAYLTRHYSTF